MILTIDPGVKASGFASWTKSGVLEGLEYGTNPPIGYHGEVHIIIEKPMIYRGSPVNPNIIVDLAFAAGELVGLALARAYELGTNVTYTTVKPSDWKGNKKKDEMLQHIISKLTPEELACLKSKKLPKSKEKELIDALGIGLWRFGRL